jgi:WD40 repeat protein
MLWDARSGERLAVLAGHNLGVTGCSFSTDARHLVSSSLDGTLRIWEVEAWTAESSSVDVARGREIIALRGRRGKALSVTYSPDGRSVASAGGGGFFAPDELRIWEAETGREIAWLQGHTEDIVSLRLFARWPPNRDGFA